MTHREFKTRFLPCHEKLYRVAFRYLGREYDAEDMVQNTYLKLWENRDNLEEIKNDEAYAIKVLKNLCLDRLRKIPWRTDDESVLLKRAGTTPRPDEKMELCEDVEILSSIVAELPDVQRKVIVMRHFEGKTTDEIEQATGLTPVNLRVILSRARKTIRELFIQRI